MYESLKSVQNNFHLYIFAFDDLSYEILKVLNLENATVIPLVEFENEALLSVKTGRTKAEYCWTCTSSTIEYVFEKFNVPVCTYIDSDLFFYNSPEALLNELTDTKTVYITEHRYSWFSKLYEEERAGRFCVQYITFVNEPQSRNVLKYWISQCTNWCYARYENGKFGDQKYLDEWPEIYDNIQISDYPGTGVAPWNILKYKIFSNQNGTNGTEKRTGKEFDVIFYHFHFVRFIDNGTIDLGWNIIPGYIKKSLYIPYINKIKETEHNLESKFKEYKTKYYPAQPSGFRDYVKYTIKKISGFNILKT